MKIDAWKCQTTGKLFEIETEFNSHKRRLSRARTVQLKKQRAEQELNQVWIDLQCEEFDISQLAIKILTRQQVLWKKSKIALSELRFQLAWSDSVRCTHSCPKSGVTNGWHGRIWWESHDLGYSDSDRFCNNNIGIHTGSGSGNSKGKGINVYSYDVSIFAADWPGPAARQEKLKMWDILKS